MKFEFDLRQKLDLAIVISGLILVVSAAFLRFFNYLFTPKEFEKFTLILIPESLIFSGLIIYKIWRLL